MWKLVAYEYKKIFKSKINILLVIAVLGGCLYMAIDQANQRFVHTSYEDENGQILSSVEVFQFMDEFQREHAGEIDDNYINELDIYYKKVLKENKNDGYDEDWMIESYGKDYKQFLKKLDDNTISEEEVHQYLYEIDTNNRIPSVSFENNHWTYETKSKYDDYERLLYDTIQLNKLKQFHQLKEIKLTMETIQNHTIKRDENTRYSSLIDDLAVMENLNQSKLDYVNRKIAALPNRNDSTVGLQILDSLLLDSNFVFAYLMVLFLILILCSGIFSYEKQTESYLLSTSKGYKQLTIAKILTAISLSVGICIMFYILIVGYVRTIVPIDHFDLVYNPSRYILKGMIYSYKEVFANSIFTFICATVACALCATFLSCFTKSKFAAIIPLLMINFMPMLVWNNLGSFINYVPSMMVYMFEVSSWYNIIGFSFEEVYSTVFSLKKIGPFMVQECTQIGIVWIIIFIILTLLCYFKQRKHIVK